MTNQGADYNAMERRKAKSDGANVVANSGRGVRKGDARLGDLLIDYKFTAGKSFSTNIEQFKKHERDARREEYQPAIVVEFNEYRDKSLVILDWDYFKMLRDELNDIKFRMEGLEK